MSKESFAENLAALDLSQVDLAVALLWLRDQEQAGTSVSAKDLASELHSLGLSGLVNVSRLAEQLGRHSDTIRTSSKFEFKIRTSRRSKLDTRYSPLVGRMRTRESDSFLQRALFEKRRDAWLQIASHLNGCYDLQYYDAAAVLARRLVESLIVALFEAKGAAAEIKHPKTGEYLLLEGLIGVVASGHHVQLSRTSRKALEPIREIGNTAAHHPYYMTTKPDLDGVAHGFRAVVTELLAKIDGK